MTGPPAVKITVVGDGMVGKTCLLIAYIKNEFPADYVPTVFENYADITELDGVEYNLKLWDTAGQEDYERLRPLSYPNTNCFLLCFSIDSRTSYDNVITKWAPEIRHHMPHTPILLIGTKMDLRNDPTVDSISEKEGRILKRKIKADGYMECSAKDMIGLKDIMFEAIRLSVRKKVPKKKHESNCCIL